MASTDIAALADLLQETAEHHDPYERSHPPHNWWDWYASYMHARHAGGTPEQSATAAGRYMEGLRHAVPGGRAVVRSISRHLAAATVFAALTRGEA